MYRRRVPALPPGFPVRLFYMPAQRLSDERKPAMPVQPEARLSRAILDALRARGAYVWKNHGDVFTRAGLPDITGSYRGLFIGVESKMPGGTTTPKQRREHQKIRSAGGHVLVATSVDQVKQWLREIDKTVDQA